MLMDEYFSAMKGVLEKVEQTQRDTIIEVGRENRRQPCPRLCVAYYGHRPHADV